MRKNVGDLVLNVDAKTVGFEGAIGSVAKLGLALEGYKTIVNSVAEPIKNLIDSFSKQEDANISLTAALKSTGQYTAKAYNDLQNYANQLQKITVVGNETSLSLMQMAINMGLSKDKAKEATKDAIALKSAFGIDLKTALRGSSLALQGQYSLLARYVPQLRGVKDEAEGAVKFQKAMADAFKIAEAKAGTFSGKMQQLNNSIGDLKEIMGGVLADQLEPFIEKLKSMAEWANNNSESVKRITKAVEIFGGVLISIKVTQSLTSLATFFSSTLPAALNMSKVAALGVQGAIGLIALEIGAMVDKYLEMKKAVKEEEEAEKTWQGTRKEVIDDTEKIVDIIHDPKQFKKLALETQIDYLKKYAHYMQMAIDEGNDPTVNKVLRKRLNLIYAQIDAIREQIKKQKELNSSKKGNAGGEIIQPMGEIRSPDGYIKPNLSVIPIKDVNDLLDKSTKKTNEWADALGKVSSEFMEIVQTVESTNDKIKEMVKSLISVGLNIYAKTNPEFAPFVPAAQTGFNMLLGSTGGGTNININNPLLLDSQSYSQAANKIVEGINRQTMLQVGNVTVR